jgi:uncharacterized membrane protein (UPF0136 family)
LFVLAAAGAYILAIAALAKARDHGGTGFQALMVAVTGVVLLAAVIIRRRAIAAGTSLAERGQHITWITFIRVAATVAVVLSVFAVIRSTPEQQAFPAILIALNLWLLSIVIRLDWAAQDAAAVGSTS